MREASFPSFPAHLHRLKIYTGSLATGTKLPVTSTSTGWNLLATSKILFYLPGTRTGTPSSSYQKKQKTAEQNNQKRTKRTGATYGVPGTEYNTTYILRKMKKSSPHLLLFLCICTLSLILNVSISFPRQIPEPDGFHLDRLPSKPIDVPKHAMSATIPFDL